MIEQKLVKTHLIVTEVYEEYSIDWKGKIIDTNPELKNGLPIFVLISSTDRVELNTININEIEECAKKITHPRGRAAVTTDKTFIYIKEIGEKETCIGVVTHNHIKKYATMYDRIGYR